ncbi:MAG: hypothetical protein U1E61_06565 [Bradyrhizobium sp.]
MGGLSLIDATWFLPVQSWPNNLALPIAHARNYSMIRKSVKRFSEKIMLKQRTKAHRALGVFAEYGKTVD